MRIRRLVPLVAFALAGLGGCQMRRPVSRGMPPSASTACVFGMRGVRAEAEDTPDGMDLFFTIVGDGAELRRRAREAMNGELPLSPETRDIKRRVTVTIADEPEGLMLHVVPLRAEELASVRDAIRRRLDEASSDDCS